MRAAAPEVADTTWAEIGPRQRSVSGSLRVAVETDGETVLSATPSLGLAHKGVEKVAESTAYAEVAELLWAAEPVAASHAELAYAMALEALAGVEVPAKAEWLRSFVMEVGRAASHVLWLGAWALDAGLTRVAAGAIDEHATLARILGEVTGNRLARRYVRAGGVAADMTAEASESAARALASFEERIGDLEKGLAAGSIFERRARGFGAIGREEALAAGATGPTLRASGVVSDVRRFAPYAAYGSVHFGVPLGVAGDCWDRCMVRLEEMRWSARTARDLLEGLPEGAHAAGVEAPLRPPPGEAYAAVESPRGELGVHLVSDGSDRPYRLRLRAPSFYNLGAAVVAMTGVPLEDAPLVLGSFDLLACEVER